MGRRERHRRDQRRRWRGSALVSPPASPGSAWSTRRRSTATACRGWSSPTTTTATPGRASTCSSTRRAFRRTRASQAGSLFTAERLGYARYTDGGAQEEIVFVSSDNGGAAPRTEGDHTIYVGQAGHRSHRLRGRRRLVVDRLPDRQRRAVRLQRRAAALALQPDGFGSLELCATAGRLTTFHPSPPAMTTTTIGPEITIDSPLDGGNLRAQRVGCRRLTPALTLPASHRARATCPTGTTSTPPRWAPTRSRSTPSTTSATETLEGRQLHRGRRHRAFRHDRDPGPTGRPTCGTNPSWPTSPVTTRPAVPAWCRASAMSPMARPSTPPRWEP